MAGDRRPATVYVGKRNGAWLIDAMNLNDDYTTDEGIDAASSLAKAKAIAREYVRSSGGSHARWEQKSERLWYLNCLMEEW